ncbi:MAG: hypothetical protein R3B48_12600 [Kofleriaceae bacterium]
MKASKLLPLFVLIAIASSVLSCGAKSPAESTTPDPALTATPFAQLNHQQQIKFMKTVVMPEMTKLFQAYDPVKFAKFNCKTCHGPDVEVGKFEMPNAGLTKLNFQDPSKMDEKAAEFMKTQVKPTMARLLQEPEYTPENPKGFGCLECHTMEEAPPAAPAADAAPAPGT